MRSFLLDFSTILLAILTIAPLIKVFHLDKLFQPLINEFAKIKLYKKIVVSVFLLSLFALGGSKSFLSTNGAPRRVSSHPLKSNVSPPVKTLPDWYLALGYDTTDTDKDGIPDIWEKWTRTNPLLYDSGLDPDGDILSNLAEFTNQLDPQCKDTDGDRIDDAIEINDNYIDPLFDTDGDGLSDYEEKGRVIFNDEFLWSDMEDGTNLLIMAENTDNALIKKKMELNLFYNNHSCHYLTIDLNGLVYLSTNKDVAVCSKPNNVALQELSEGDIAIAPFWDDLICRTNLNTQINFKEDLENGWTVVEFKDISLKGETYTNETATFQVLIPYYENKVYVSYLYCTCAFQEVSPTLGVKLNKYLDRGLPNDYCNKTYSYNNANVFKMGVTLVFNYGYMTDFEKIDTDEDDIYDYDEVMVHYTDPRAIDTDNDGISDPDEFAFFTNPRYWDTDSDFLSDKWEVENGLDPNSRMDDDGYAGDPDGDGIPNYEERELGTNPKSPDTDRDGLTDKEETAWFERTNEIIPISPTNGFVTHYSESMVSYGKVSLPFTTYIAGVRSRSVRLSVNGVVGFIDEQNDDKIYGVGSNNYDLHDHVISKYHTSIAAFWTRLYPSYSNCFVSVSQVEAESREYCVIHYENFVPYNNRQSLDNRVTFQVLIPKDEPNTVIVQYLEVVGNINQGHLTIGAQSPKAVVNFPIDYNPFRRYGEAETGKAIIYHFGTSTFPLIADIDGDGLKDGIEFQIGTNPREADTDKDGFSDLWEYKNGLNPHSGEGDNGPNGDPDGDYLTNRMEYEHKTHPKKQDTDDDGLRDIEEVGGIERAIFPWLTITNAIDVAEMFESKDKGIVMHNLDDPLYVQGYCISNLAINLNGVLHLIKPSNNSAMPNVESYYGIESTHFRGPFITIAPYLNDMKVVTNSPPSKIMVGESFFEANRFFVVEYDNMNAVTRSHQSIINRISFQVAIPYAPTNHIYVKYKECSPMVNGELATIGFRTMGGNEGYSYCYNQAGKVYWGLALRFVFSTGTNPSLADGDFDGLNDSEELAIGTDPFEPDTDGDGLFDGWEYTHGFNSKVNNYYDDVLGAYEDPDNDGLSNYDEAMYGTDPFESDSDEDGVTDGDEVTQNSDPADDTDEGLPDSRVRLTFDIGDHSGSYSEKYGLELTRSSSNNGQPGDETTSETIRFVNAYYGGVENRRAFLHRGENYSARLYHVGTNLDTGPDYDYTLNLWAGDVAVIIDDPNEIIGTHEGKYDLFTSGDPVFTIKVLDLTIAADYDRDGKINEDDKLKKENGAIFRHWINNDNDNGDYSVRDSDYPEQGGAYNPVTWANCEDGDVDGRCDLLDFAPIHLEIHDMLLQIGNSIDDYRFTLSQDDEAVNVVWTTLTRENANRFLYEDFTDFGTKLSKNSYSAETTKIKDTRGTELPYRFIRHIIDNPDSGIVMVEGRKASSRPLLFNCYKRKYDSDDMNDGLVFQKRLDMSISSIDDMYRFHNIRFSRALQNRDAEPPNLPDSECDNIDLFLAHGFLVAENESRSWGAEFFKRLWQEGSKARFHNVTWSSDTGGGVSYEENVNKAFLTSEDYASLVNEIKTANQSRVVVMAHSLGNMLTSAAIEDHGLNADTYFALNAAVPVEAFDLGLANSETNSANPLLHPEWRGFKAETWAANYHSLFQDETEFPNDDRARLTWRGRFSSVAPKMYNFWSSGDEVLEIKDTSQSDLDVVSGMEFDWEWTFPPVSVNARRYAWQKQALFKGRSWLYGTRWAGWGFETNVVISAVNELSCDYLRSTPIFNHYPEYMFTNAISSTNINRILSRGIPELSYPLGYTSLNKGVCRGNYDMNRVLRRSDNEWPQRDIDFNTSDNTRPNRWLHTDLLNVGHFFTYKLFLKIIELGELK